MKTVTPKLFEIYVRNIECILDGHSPDHFVDFCKAVGHKPTFEEGLYFEDRKTDIIRNILKKSKKIKVDEWLDLNDFYDLDWEE